MALPETYSVLFGRVDDYLLDGDDLLLLDSGQHGQHRRIIEQKLLEPFGRGQDTALLLPERPAAEQILIEIRRGRMRGRVHLPLLDRRRMYPARRLR